MTFLTDSELKVLLNSTKPPITGLDLPLRGDLDSISSPIQPCSVDLRISEVFLPFNDEETDLKAVRRTSHHFLGVGESVKVTTIETFDLSNTYGALLVAPARLTRQGIIVPDVGHIDPGFRGQLRITLINIGRHPYELSEGDTIVTVLLFRLPISVGVGLRDRTDADQPYAKGLEDIRHLSADFLNIESRVKKLAGDVALATLGESGWRRAFFSWCLPIIIGVLVWWATYYFSVESRLKDLETKADFFNETQQLGKRVDQLELKLNGLTSTATTNSVESKDETKASTISKPKDAIPQGP